MTPWMGALTDNLEVLATPQEGGGWGRAATNDLLASRIKIRSMNFMRGRTFLSRYLIIDEAQNLSSKQMKTLITRAGPGTQDRLPRQRRTDRHPLPHRNDVGADLCGRPLQGLGALRARHASSRRTFTPRRLRVGDALTSPAVLSTRKRERRLPFSCRPLRRNVQDVMLRTSLSTTLRGATGSCRSCCRTGSSRSAHRAVAGARTRRGNAASNCRRNRAHS